MGAVAGTAAIPAARCRNLRRGSFIAPPVAYAFVILQPSADRGHASRVARCPLSGVKRKWPLSVVLSGYEPKPTLAGSKTRTAARPDLILANLICCAYFWPMGDRMRRSVRR